MAIRPVRLTELAEWLEENADMQMVEADTLARKLVNQFDVMTYVKEPV